MRPINWYYMWTTGSFSISHTFNLNPDRAYLVTGGLVLKQGSDYAHAFISEVCTSSGDQVLCGLRGTSGDTNLNLYEFISRAISVTITLRTTGGRHRVEGSIYQL